MKRIAFLLCLLLPLLGWGQSVKLSDKVDQFLPDLQKLMASGGPAALQVEKDFETLWSESALTATQRDRLMTLCRQMNQKRYQPAAHFSPLLASVYHIVHTAKPAASAPDIDNLLTVAEKQFALNDPKAFAQNWFGPFFHHQRHLIGNKAGGSWPPCCSWSASRTGLRGPAMPRRTYPPCRPTRLLSA